MRCRTRDRRRIHLAIGLISILLLSGAGTAFAEGIGGIRISAGALGDSLTDEYLGNQFQIGSTDLPALNWVQILQQTRGREIDFGAIELDFMVRGEPRNEGLEHNWARSGAGALPNPFFLPFASVTAQAAGLAPAVSAGEVNVVFVGIGSNDYFFRELLGGSFELDDPGYQAFEDSMLAAMEGAILTLQAAGPVEIILARVPAGTAGGTDPVTVAAIEHYNGRLAQAAEELGAVFFDQFAFTSKRGRVVRGDFRMGPFKIPFDSVASLDDTVPEGTPFAGPCDSLGNCATLEYARNFTASDNLHPNTVVQGLIANEALKALNTRIKPPIPLLSDIEIILAATLQQQN